jgi:hypothetical protein
MCHGAVARHGTALPVIFIILNITWNICSTGFTTSSLYLVIQAKLQNKTSANWFRFHCNCEASNVTSQSGGLPAGRLAQTGPVTGPVNVSVIYEQHGQARQ